MNTPSKRIFTDALIILSLLFLPWWCTALLVIGGIFIFEWFYEAIFSGFVMDSLYGVPTSFFHGFTFVMTLGAALVLAIFMYVKPMLR